MSTVTAFEVPTKVLNDQARVILRDLDAPEKAPRIAELKGLDANFKNGLATELLALEANEADQERAKSAYVKEAGDAQLVAEEGYRWVLELHANARAHLACVEQDPADLPGALRFGHLHSARARGVVYEMRILIPEVEKHVGVLGPHGADAAFIARGKDVLVRLGVEQQEASDAKAAREALTRKVRQGEVRLSRFLRQLVAADEAASTRIPTRKPAFPLDTINAELARQAADKAARLAAAPGSAVSVED